MQLWLKSIAGVSEYAMNKPEGEIWPDTQVTEINFYPYETPDNMVINPCAGGQKITFLLQNLDGARMEMKLEGGTKQILDRIALTWRSIERHRTHCPECWQKIEGSVYLHTEVAGHEAFHCPADTDWDDRFPREG